MLEGEVKDAVVEGLRALGRIAGTLEAIAKMARWSWRRERRRENALESATSNLSRSRLLVRPEKKICMYCGAMSQGVARGSVVFGCMHCITQAFQESLQRETGRETTP